MPATYLEKKMKELVNRTPVAERNEFVVKQMPNGCKEYISEGFGDTNCTGTVKRLSKHIGQCRVCKTMYLVKE